MSGDGAVRGEAGETIRRLGLTPHPEGGHFRRVWTSATVLGPGDRRAASSIVYLLDAGEASTWHRVRDADETWHHLEGGPIELRLSPDGLSEQVVVLGAPAVRGATRVVVPAGWWQTASTPEAFAVAACTVAPEFLFSSFELAPPCWSPGSGPPS